MKQQKTRELLVTTKVAQKWNEDFELRVEELINLVSKVDTDTTVQHATETLDVYHNTQKQKVRRRKTSQSDRPFEFLVFRN
ncbi:MAG TPA: hypothetical protein PL009_03780 [Flavipsychrobacter sp.]|nr:hypothetical protein [Flavipsychrobacter sp.]